jgi:ABC-type phosphate transport system substrate-binding protein
MIKIRDKIRYAPLAFVAAALLIAVAVIGSGTSTTATFASASCPVTVRAHGSTTVYPILGDEPGYGNAGLHFEATRAGVDVQPTAIGSGNGINELLSLFHGGSRLNDMAPSSRELNPGDEQNQLWQFLIARDAFVIAVHDSGNMAFISNIVDADIKGIYEGTITNWNHFPGGPNQPIVPRARITGSGSQPEFLQHFAINSTLENNTIVATGLPRLTESADMAAAVEANDYQIAYTGLPFLTDPGLKALTLDGIAPNTTTVGNGTYPNSGRRDLYFMLPKLSYMNRIDDSPTVLADDWLNYMDSASGQADVSAAGDVAVPAVSQRIPDWDVNMNGTTSLSDLGAITAKWGQSSTCDGWIRADVNNNHSVGLTDVTAVINKWGNTGLVPPS